MVSECPGLYELERKQKERLQRLEPLECQESRAELWVASERALEKLEESASPFERGVERGAL